MLITFFRPEDEGSYGVFIGVGSPFSPDSPAAGGVEVFVFVTLTLKTVTLFGIPPSPPPHPNFSTVVFPEVSDASFRGFSALWLPLCSRSIIWVKVAIFLAI